MRYTDSAKQNGSPPSNRHQIFSSYSVSQGRSPQNIPASQLMEQDEVSPPETNLKQKEFKDLDVVAKSNSASEKQLESSPRKVGTSYNIDD